MISKLFRYFNQYFHIHHMNSVDIMISLNFFMFIWLLPNKVFARICLIYNIFFYYIEIYQIFVSNFLDFTFFFLKIVQSCVQNPLTIFLKKPSQMFDRILDTLVQYYNWSILYRSCQQLTNRAVIKSLKNIKLSLPGLIFIEFKIMFIFSLKLCNKISQQTFVLVQHSIFCLLRRLQDVFAKLFSKTS